MGRMGKGNWRETWRERLKKKKVNKNSGPRLKSAKVRKIQPRIQHHGLTAFGSMSLDIKLQNSKSRRKK